MAGGDEVLDGAEGVSGGVRGAEAEVLRARVGDGGELLRVLVKEAEADADLAGVRVGQLVAAAVLRAHEGQAAVHEVVVGLGRLLGDGELLDLLALRELSKVGASGLRAGPKVLLVRGPRRAEALEDLAGVLNAPLHDGVLAALAIAADLLLGVRRLAVLKDAVGLVDAVGDGEDLLVEVLEGRVGDARGVDTDDHVEKLSGDDAVGAVARQVLVDGAVGRALADHLGDEGVEAGVEELVEVINVERDLVLEDGNVDAAGELLAAEQQGGLLELGDRLAEVVEVEPLVGGRLVGARGGGLGGGAEEGAGAGEELVHLSGDVVLVAGARELGTDALLVVLEVGDLSAELIEEGADIIVRVQMLRMEGLLEDVFEARQSVAEVGEALLPLHGGFGLGEELSHRHLASGTGAAGGHVSVDFFFCLWLHLKGSSL